MSLYIFSDFHSEWNTDKHTVLRYVHTYTRTRAHRIPWKRPGKRMWISLACKYNIVRRAKNVSPRVHVYTFIYTDTRMGIVRTERSKRSTSPYIGSERFEYERWITTSSDTISQIKTGTAAPRRWGFNVCVRCKHVLFVRRSTHV